jgi:hypothetical protein
MAHTYDELKTMTVAQLREVAKGIQHEAVRGYTQLNKDHLLVAVCRALGLDTHVHHHVVGLDKAAIKARIRALKKERDAALEAHDHAGLSIIRRRIHRLKRDIHKATV